MSAPALDLTSGDRLAGQKLAGSEGYFFASAERRGDDVSLAPPAEQGSAYFSPVVDFDRPIERHSPAADRGDVDHDDAVATASEAAGGEDAAPASGRGFVMVLRRLAGRAWRALRSFQPMFPPMSCC